MDHRAKKKLRSEDEKEDRISKLSDDLIHQIMLFLDTRFAVQTSALSKRWKLVWKTLPFLSFHGYDQHYKGELNKFIYSKFINHVFSRRNHQCRIHKLDLCPNNGLHINCLIKYVKYAISHDVESLNVHDLNHYCVLSMFNSNSLKELKLTMPFDYDDVMESACWSLPNLTNLYLKRSHNFKLKDRADYKFEGKFPQSCLICLSALTSLSLDNCTLPEIFSLPSLTTLKLKNCALPKNVWDLPALLNLELDHMILHTNMGVYFLVLANLRNLAIYSKGWDIKNCVISCVQLVNLKISALVYTAVDSKWKIVVSAPKLCNFTAVGSFPITFDGCELENVEIKSFKSDFFREGKPQDQCKMMFSQLGSAKNVTLDLETLQELSKISDKLVHLESPFYNLKHLKLPRGCKESSISSIVRRYLLGTSPKATIVERLKTSVQMMKLQGKEGRSFLDVRMDRIKPTNCLRVFEKPVDQMRYDAMDMREFLHRARVYNAEAQSMNIHMQGKMLDVLRRAETAEAALEERNKEKKSLEQKVAEVDQARKDAVDEKAKVEKELEAEQNKVSGLKTDLEKAVNDAQTKADADRNEITRLNNLLSSSYRPLLS